MWLPPNPYRTKPMEDKAGRRKMRKEKSRRKMTKNKLDNSQSDLGVLQGVLYQQLLEILNNARLGWNDIRKHFEQTLSELTNFRHHYVWRLLQKILHCMVEAEIVKQVKTTFIWIASQKATA